MLKKIMLPVVLGLFLTTFVSSAFAACSCRADKQIKEEKQTTCQCCGCQCQK